ncbi:MAG TPA: carboxypeptidase-like regulatory domain-containing protein, partial [Pyrinomonadaceae bacterium]|nr:carboxypeptidase-like regulatory domain-containing protein [Pyrinomonadaceae bacterium]
MKSNRRALVLMIVSLLLAAPVLAQTHRASLRGTIYDPNKATIPGATIKLTSLATGETRSTSTGENGEYAISSLAPGSYQIEIEKPAFKKYIQQIELLVNQEPRLDATLEVGGLSPSSVDTSF